MNRNTVLLVAAAFLVGLATTSLFVPSTFMRSGGFASPEGSEADRLFIEQMIPHHEDALTMASLAATRARRPEILKLARDIQRTQQAEIDQMKAWYAEWFGGEIPARGTRAMAMAHAPNLEALRTSSDFDQQFIVEMIPHHQMAVMMAQMVGASTERPEMKRLAEDIITAQSREIEAMRTWYEKWY